MDEMRSQEPEPYNEQQQQQEQQRDLSTAANKLAKQLDRKVDSQSIARRCQMRKMSSIMSISRSRAKMERGAREKRRRPCPTMVDIPQLFFCSSPQEKDNFHNHHNNIVVPFFSLLSVICSLLLLYITLLAHLNHPPFYFFLLFFLSVYQSN